MTDLPPPAYDESELFELAPSAAEALAAELPYSVRFTLRGEITPLQQAFLDRTGYLVFDRVASTEEVDTILAEVERVEAKLIEEETRTLFGVPIWFGRNPDGKRWLQRMGFTSVLSEYLSGFVKHDRFEPVRRLIGDDARIGEREKDGVVFNRYVHAEGSLRPNLAWHTDALRDVFYNRRMPGPMLNVGLHFDRITPQDGCLIVLPGMHTQSAWSTLFSKIHFVTDKPDPNEVKVETWPGDLTVHDGRMWHRVQTSPHTGWKSLRRSMYVPYVVDAYAPKDEHTKTNLYMRLFDWIIRRKTRRMEKWLLAG
ncbi:MAG: phytanoyl-CoA dioxygenase family protein [Proteobacteria bacterium]|nr:phytanoyl-CoA dioxygenase family protein [Pseudomonadota bacterium]